MNNIVLELFGQSTASGNQRSWTQRVRQQQCPYISKKCLKIRKSQPDLSIGTCLVSHGRSQRPIMICPFRMLENRQIFVDSLHLLSLHEPGNELHVLSELNIPGGKVDYFLVSARNGKPKDFVGIELQTLDTTGTVWPARQRFLHSKGIKVAKADRSSTKSFNMNWKMTEKTILLQLHHKIQTFEHLSKHLVLVVQDDLLVDMRKKFSFDHLNSARTGDSMHIHSYTVTPQKGKNACGHRLELANRFSTDANGISRALGLQAEANIELSVILSEIERKISAATRWTPA